MSNVLVNNGVGIFRPNVFRNAGTHSALTRLDTKRKRKEKKGKEKSVAVEIQGHEFESLFMTYAYFHT